MNKTSGRILAGRLFPKFLIVVAAGLLIACAGGNRSAVRPAQQSEPDRSVERQLRQAAASWHRTPHRLGGQSRLGIDCSGLVMVLYKDLFDIDLPRTTADQVHRGRFVKRSTLAAGDLVFFHPPGKVRHVGIYLGDGEFVHTSARHGVMISRMKDRYWRNCYWTARRIL